MAGRVRHPIDVEALEKYISRHVPEIKVPLDVKQVNKQNKRGSPLSLSADVCLFLHHL